MSFIDNGTITRVQGTLHATCIWWNMAKSIYIHKKYISKIYTSKGYISKHWYRGTYGNVLKTNLSTIKHSKTPFISTESCNPSQNWKSSKTLPPWNQQNSSPGLFSRLPVLEINGFGASEFEANSLFVSVEIEGVFTTLSSNSRRLDASKRHVEIAYQPAVTPHRADLSGGHRREFTRFLEEQ